MKLLISWLVTIVSIIIMIPFLTLLERKILSYIQTRKGPKKVRFLGLLQPITDGVKLVLKESGHKIRTKKKIFWISPLFNFFFYAFIFYYFLSNLSKIFIKIRYFRLCMYILINGLYNFGFGMEKKI